MLIQKCWKLKTVNYFLLSKCTVRVSKKSGFIKEQEGKWLLSSLDLKTSLSNIPLLGKILFWFRIKWMK